MAYKPLIYTLETISFNLRYYMPIFGFIWKTFDFWYFGMAAILNFHILRENRSPNQLPSDPNEFSTPKTPLVQNLALSAGCEHLPSYITHICSLTLSKNQISQLALQLRNLSISNQGQLEVRIKKTRSHKHIGFLLIWNYFLLFNILFFCQIYAFPVWWKLIYYKNITCCTCCI